MEPIFFCTTLVSRRVSYTLLTWPYSDPILSYRVMSFESIHESINQPRHESINKLNESIDQ